MSLAFILAGCAQTPAIRIDDSADLKKPEQWEMVPESSGQDTNQELSMDREGGG